MVNETINNPNLNSRHKIWTDRSPKTTGRRQTHEEMLNLISSGNRKLHRHIAHLLALWKSEAIKSWWVQRKECSLITHTITSGDKWAAFLSIINILLPYNLAILFLDIHLKGLKMCVCMQACKRRSWQPKEFSNQDVIQ